MVAIGLNNNYYESDTHVREMALLCILGSNRYLRGHPSRIIPHTLILINQCNHICILVIVIFKLEQSQFF